ncbi:MAG: Stp1/IreP family PP2C-type Ser/Thr phosphatase [Lachnospiraceae bacterium]|nr:Stp1/IreP family PP2C-type Ser/Thr phosphatase [Lachnospiraceae bacterium]
MVSYCQTDVGRKRSLNEDFVYASQQSVGPLKNLFIVADGMGGHNAGEIASRLAVESMVDHIESAAEGSPIRILDSAVLAANQAVAEKAGSDKSFAGMGTTLVACTLEEDCLYLLNVGDSRLYIVGEQIQQITRDHSLVEEMVRRGELARSQAQNHPEKNVITRAIGARSTVRADLFDVTVQEGEIVLLCSDGLTNMVEDEQILEILQSEPELETAGRKLIEAANLNGGADNISVILIRVGSGD